MVTLNTVDQVFDKQLSRNWPSMQLQPRSLLRGMLFKWKVCCEACYSSERCVARRVIQVKGMLRGVLFKWEACCEVCNSTE